MNANKVLISTLIGAIASFILGFLIYGFVLDSFMRNNAGTPAGMMKENPDMIAMVIANLALAFLFSYIFARWAGIKTLQTGAGAGALIGFLMITTFDLLMYSTSNMMNLTGVFADILAFTVMSAGVAGIVGWWLGRGEKV
jgi:uncharacterized membrane protein